MRLRSLARRLSLVAALALPLALAAGRGAAEDSPPPAASSSAKSSKLKAKVAYVDLDRAIRENEDGLRAAAALARFKAEKQRTVSATEERLARQQDELRAMAQNPPPGGNLQSAAMQYQKDVQAYQELLKRVNGELGDREDALMYPIEKKIKGILSRFAEQEGWDLVIDKKAYWGSLSNGLDLTDRVICDYNWGAGRCGVGVTPLPAPASSAPPAAPVASTK